MGKGAFTRVDFQGKTRCKGACFPPGKYLAEKEQSTCLSEGKRDADDSLGNSGLWIYRPPYGRSSRWPEGRPTRSGSVAGSIPGAGSFAGEWGAARSYGSYRELARDPQIDAVYIATIHPFHAEAVRLCLEGGKAVLCEKPLAMTEKEASELFDLAARKQLLLMEGMWTVFLPCLAGTEKTDSCRRSGEDTRGDGGLFRRNAV